MNRIDARFAALRAAGRTGLIPFVTAGDPSADATVAIMHALVDAGADLVELGVPFSDPMADGPVIQHANERALARGVGLARVLAYVREFRARDATTPVVLMGYLNPIEIHGSGRFADEAKDAADGDSETLFGCAGRFVARRGEDLAVRAALEHMLLEDAPRVGGAFGDELLLDAAAGLAERGSDPRALELALVAEWQGLSGVEVMPRGDLAGGLRDAVG